MDTINKILDFLEGLFFGWLPECELCAKDGFPGQTGHSTTSCEADRLRYPESYRD